MKTRIIEGGTSTDLTVRTDPIEPPAVTFPGQEDVVEILPARTDRRAPGVPVLSEESSLLPVHATAQIEPGFGYSIRLEKLRATMRDDPEVSRIFEGLRRMIGVEVSGEGTLAAELARRDSVSRGVLSAYLEWVAHRGAKEAPQSEKEQEERRQLDPALMRTRIDAIIDLIMERVVTLDVPIPQEAAQAFIALFQGAAKRIQTRADTWMLNSSIGEIYDTEKILLAGQPIDPEALWKGIQQINALDGGTPFGFQRPLPPGEKRLIWGVGWMESGKLPQGAASTALVRQGGSSLVLAERRTSLINVLQQSPEASTAIERIEQKLRQLDPRTPEYAESLDVYNSYATALLYDSHKIWANSGVIDRLAEAVIEVGSRENREAMLSFLYEGIDTVRSRIFVDFRRNETSYRDIYLALTNVVRSRQKWDRETLDFVFEKLAWLECFSHPNELPSEQAQAAYDEVMRVRRSEVPDPTQALAVMRAALTEPKLVHLGPYHMKLAVREPGVLEVRNLQTDLKEDYSELYQTLRHLEQLARGEGFRSMELADWRNIHEARVFKSSGEYVEVIKPVPVGNRSIDTPTFIKDLTRPVLPEGWDVSELGRYLDSSGSRALLRIGGFMVALRKQPLIAVGSDNALTVSSIDADQPGSGQYPLLLKTLEAEAKRRGFDALQIEGVDNPRHHRFYEERMNYQRVPRSHEQLRSYFTKL